MYICGIAWGSCSNSLLQKIFYMSKEGETDIMFLYIRDKIRGEARRYYIINIFRIFVYIRG